tara:strand:- start:431 stop:604 length:174 start_codon:yes stop_codon:yes gene_type:complete
MIRKWRDYFTGECDTCGEELTKEGILYVINKSQGLCVDCYENAEIYLVDEVHRSDKI